MVPCSALINLAYGYGIVYILTLCVQLLTVMWFMSHQIPTQQTIVIQRNHSILKIGMRKVRMYMY